MRAYSSAGEHYVDIVGVTGSIPVTPTIILFLETFVSGSPLIVIPARLAAQRLPGKPLAEIAGKPMILHVWERACQANVGPVIVACDGPEIAAVISKAGGNAVATSPDLLTGSDRVYAAANLFDPQEKYTTLINLQGDLPTLDPCILKDVLIPLQEDPTIDMATPVTAIEDPEEYHTPSVVKVALSLKEGRSWGRAFYFSRAPIPHGLGPWYHHIGIYAYRRAALKQFVSLPQTLLEKQEKLEQLRGLEHGLSIAGIMVKAAAPFGVDTADDLVKARGILEA